MGELWMNWRVIVRHHCRRHFVVTLQFQDLNHGKVDVGMSRPRPDAMRNQMEDAHGNRMSVWTPPSNSVLPGVGCVFRDEPCFDNNQCCSEVCKVDGTCR